MTYAEKLVFIIFFEGCNPDKYPDFEQAISILNPVGQHLARTAIEAIKQAQREQREACWKNYIDEMSSGMPVRDNFYNSNLHEIAKRAILNAEVEVKHGSKLD